MAARTVPVVTERALGLLAAMLDRAEASDGVAIRIVARPEGWRMRLDLPSPEDEVFDYEGRTVLILDTGVAERLEDDTLDVNDTREGPRLKLR